VTYGIAIRMAVMSMLAGGNAHQFLTNAGGQA
jgi:hypothetical protein